MKFLFPALCWGVLLGGFACAKRPVIHPSGPPVLSAGEPYQEDAPRKESRALELQAGHRAVFYFAFDSETLTETEKAAALARRMVRDGMSIALVGYASEEGSEEYNLALGERRAKVVCAYLVAAGVEADRIRRTSYGEENPVTHDPEQFHLNRRVEAILEDRK
jgi:peptidoglycan-associated lipoprotein